MCHVCCETTSPTRQISPNVNNPNIVAKKKQITIPFILNPQNLSSLVAERKLDYEVSQV